MTNDLPDTAASEFPDTSRSRPGRFVIALAVVLVALVSLAIVASGDDRPEVVLYVSADDYVAREIVNAFEDAHDLRVRMVGDLEAQKTTGLAQRLLREADRPQADVFWSSEVFAMIQLAQDGVLAPHDSPAVADWPASLRGRDGLWHGFAARARVIVYAPDRVPADVRPMRWLDLTHQRWRGRLVMADPRYGTTRGHMGAMKVYWDRAAMPGFFEAYVAKLADNEVRMLPSGNAGVVEAVARGEADLGMTDTDDVWAAQANGLDVALIYPTHDLEPDRPGAGTLLIPNSVARVKGGPNPDAAAILIDFLLSAEVERRLAETDSHNVPTRPEVAAAYPQYAVDNPLDVDFARVAAVMDEAVAFTVRTLTGAADD